VPLIKLKSYFRSDLPKDFLLKVLFPGASAAIAPGSNGPLVMEIMSEGVQSGVPFKVGQPSAGTASI
jgi:hypothetical protein